MDPIPAQTIRILLVDDHALLRQALRMIIEQRPDMLVVGEAADAAEALRLAEHTQPDVIVLDLNLDGEDALPIIPALRAAAAGSQILVLTGLSESHLHQRAAHLGAIGLVQKRQALDHLIRAIERVSRGEAYLDPRLVAHVLTARSALEGVPPDPQAARVALLTERERAVVRLVCAGLPNKAIALRLSISETTVRHHLTSVFGKLDLTSRVELVLYAHRHGLADEARPAPR